FGLMIVVATALLISLRLRSGRLLLPSITKYDFLFCILLFLIIVFPFLILNRKTEYYGYTAGIPSALLLGTFADSLYRKSTTLSNYTPASVLPLILVVIPCIVATVISSSTWITVAETSNAVLGQIQAQQPRVKIGTFIVLKYSKPDLANWFPAAFG